ncbi:unnamed protein product [Protopolystoma xenopodis]|uniref:Uncharacterized protein n=1 Tax=Protopolystoma xenopodis TaxID=117903 RepID=A0A3S4ZZ41_9PLAT|nr:unnamed protein product [Protopolystoma xenopodis]
MRIKGRPMGPMAGQTEWAKETREKKIDPFARPISVPGPKRQRRRKVCSRVAIPRGHRLGNFRRFKTATTHFPPPNSRTDNKGQQEQKSVGKRRLVRRCCFGWPGTKRFPCLGGRLNWGEGKKVSAPPQSRLCLFFPRISGLWATRTPLQSAIDPLPESGDVTQPTSSPALARRVTAGRRRH